MNRITLFCFALSLIFTACSPNVSDRDKQKEAAVEASLHWLALLDSEEYDQSWKEASQSFQNLIDRELWREIVNNVRSPLGNLISRELLTIQYTANLPEAPEGEYFIIQFESNFTNMENAIETLTPSLEEDKIWRVSGYYIR